MTNTTTFQVGDRLLTPSGRTGEILTPQGNEVMPLHCLVKFANGDRQWLLAEILKIAP